MNGIQEPKINRVRAQISNAVRLTGICRVGLRRMPSKVCRICGIEKDVSEFGVHKYTIDGLRHECKPCRRIEGKIYRNKNKESIKFYRKEWYSSHKDYHRIYHKKYYIDNFERLSKYREEYRKTDAGIVVEIKKRHNRRSRLKQTENTLTYEQWSKILLNQNNKCAICGKKFCKSRPPTSDHIIPLSRGGGLTFENVQALCGICNSIKHNSLDKTNIRTWIHTSA